MPPWIVVYVCFSSWGGMRFGPPVACEHVATSEAEAIEYGCEWGFDGFHILALPSGRESYPECDSAKDPTHAD